MTPTIVRIRWPHFVFPAMFLVGCADTRHHIVVQTTLQRMVVFDEGKAIATYPVSTSRFGLGDLPRSNFTPTGRLKVTSKIGGGQPAGMKFKDRKPTGEIVPVNAPGRDPIVTRILRLRGCEACNANAYGRYIYIHGTPEERSLGRPASYGCIRMASRDIIELYDIVGNGVRVDVVP
jgi:lipoprotein-anchoring transpeptidase ErfK/SrfK